MKNFPIVFWALIIIAGVTACRKTSFITSPDAQLQTQTDTLRFDTVFTSTGSVTRGFKIFNVNDQKLRLSSVKLMGGASSPFKINLDGSAGTDFHDVVIDANDSVYVFVSVAINPNAANLPFIVRDSILINYNGNNRFVQLEAFGQNAVFLRDRRVQTNETFRNTLPVVILGGLTVDRDVILTIDKGTKIYCHADAPIIINGSLKVNGEHFDSTRVVFRGDRLDDDYRDYPGSWPGIYFNSSSKDNVLNYVIIKNAYRGIVVQSPASNGLTKVTLNECIIDNVYDAGIYCLNSSLNARNCLVTNCGANIFIAGGGRYSLLHCTVAGLATNFIDHRVPVLSVSNGSTAGPVNDLVADFRNCIFYGDSGRVDDEIVIDKKAGAGAFSMLFENVLYSSFKTDPALTYTFTNSLKNEPPQFDSIDARRQYFNFRLGPQSRAINTGVAIAGISFDLDGSPRIIGGVPDIGCYERQ